MNDQNKLTGKELGVYLGILCGIAFLQATGLIVGLVTLPLLGFAFGRLFDRVSVQSNLRRTWIEEE